MTSVAVTLPPEAVEAIAERAAEIVLERLRGELLAGGPRWLYGARAAADYLGWPVGRVQKMTAAGAIPCHREREGGRASYRADELDEWLEGQREGPAPALGRLRAV